MLKNYFLRKVTVVFLSVFMLLGSAQGVFAAPPPKVSISDPVDWLYKRAKVKGYDTFTYKNLQDFLIYERKAESVDFDDHILDDIRSMALTVKRGEHTFVLSTELRWSTRTPLKTELKVLAGDNIVIYDWDNIKAPLVEDLATRHDLGELGGFVTSEKAFSQLLELLFTLDDEPIVI